MRRIRSSILQFRGQAIRRSLDSLPPSASGSYSNFNQVLQTRAALHAVPNNSRWLSSYRGRQGRGSSVTSQLFPNQHRKQREILDERDPRHTKGHEERVFGHYNANENDGQFSVLQERISSAGTSGELLDLVEGFNSESVDDRVLMTILQTLFHHVKLERSDASKKDVLNSVGMQKVCKVLRHHSRWMSPNDLLTSLKVLIFLNAPANHSTLGMILHLLSKHANSLTLREMMYLYFLLPRTPETPITSALTVALPIVFESQLQLQADTTDLTLMADTLQFACRTSLGDKTVEFICDALLRQMDKLTGKQGLTILCAFADSKRSFPYQVPLLEAGFKVVTAQMDHITIEDLLACSLKVSKKFSRYTPEFYNEDFVNGLCGRILSKDVNPRFAMFLLKPISLMKHVNIDILERVCDMTLANPTAILNSDYLFTSLIRTFSGANYKPEKWSTLAPIFLEHPAMTKDLGSQEIAIAVDFLSIDVLPTTLVAKIFSPDYLSRLLDHAEKGSPHLLLLIYNSVKLLYPEYDGPLPPNSLLEKWRNQLLKIPKIYPLRAALESGFGGENYLVTGLFHEGFHIDHGVLMRKGGYPISIKTSEPETLSRLQEMLPAESIVVMVKAFLTDSYARNTNRLRGVHALELRLIEKLGYPVVTVDVQRWKDLQDYEKIPYLMKQIREKSEKFYSNIQGQGHSHNNDNNNSNCPPP